MEAMDMDQFTNPQVRQAIGILRREVQSIQGIRVLSMYLEPALQGRGRLSAGLDETKDGLKERNCV